MTTAVAEPQISVARQQLSEIISDLESTKSALRNAEQSVESAAEALEKSRAGLETFADLDQRIERFRQNTSRAGMALTLPAEFSEQQRERTLAQDELGRQEKALMAAEEELVAARAHLAKAKRAHEWATMRVFAEYLERLIKDLEEVNQRRELLQVMLRGAGLPYLGWERIQVNQREGYVHAALKNLGLPNADPADWNRLHTMFTGALNKPGLMPSTVAHAAAHWAKFAETLMTDPNAEAAALPSWETLLS